MKQLLTRELAQPFDPDGLPCGAPVGDFVITTEEALKDQLLAAGKTYLYPLKLLANQGYHGTVRLSLTATPPDPALAYELEPGVVSLTERASATLSVRAVNARAPRILTVRGTDAAGKTNRLCLYLTPRQTGSMQVLASQLSGKKPTKNLEIILDASGSMKQRLGKKTRWETALEVLEQVLAKLPEDFQVGLRIYGHREPSRSPQTCTDSELVVPVAKLDRAGILAAANAVKPRGETPLVYSLLQTPGDLKEAGGGSVVLVTDGEESCKGDLAAAPRQLSGSGVDVRVDIVGFTLKGKEARGKLASLAKATGGRYYGAESGEALARAVLFAAIEKFPYRVRDAGGREVARGEAGGAAHELPPGEYRVTVLAGDQEATAQVRLGAGEDAALRLALEGDQVVIRR